MVECTPVIDVRQILGPILVANVIKGGEIDITPLIDAMVGEQITQALLSSITLPSEVADMGDIICLMINLEQIKGLQALLRGETYEFGIDKVVELIVTLNMMSALTSAL